MGHLSRDEKNHFRLMKLLEFRESVAMGHVNRLLFRLYQHNLGRTTAPTEEEIFDTLQEAHPDFRNVTTLAEYIGYLESLLSASNQKMDLETARWLDSHPIENVTPRTIENYVSKSGADLEEIHDRMNYKAVQITQEITSVTERRLRDLVAENVISGTLHRTSRERKTEYVAKMLSPRSPMVALPNAETIIRTQSMQILNASAVNGAQSTPRLRDRLVGWRYCANGDSRTRDSHRQQDGVVARKSHPYWDIWTPPNGYNCRCFLIPIYDERKLEGGKQPNMNIRPDPGFEFNPAKVYE